jgi:adenosylcobinamide-phosphate synthase
VERSLRAGDLNAARRGLSALCSRDPAQLDEEQVAGAAASSLAENLADSVVAPLVYFALFGLAGALVFRVVNTLDAMVGYRGRYEWLGKPAARLDDLLGWVPARLTVIALLASACALRLPVRAGLRAWRRDGRLTPSPNGGQPMATLAGTLGVRLHKPESYTLLPEGRRPGAETLAQARSLVGVAMVVAGLVSLGLVWCSGPARGLWDPAGAPW